MENECGLTSVLDVLFQPPVYVKEGALGLVAEGKSGLDSRPYDLISLDCSTKHSSFREIINSSKKKLSYCEAG